MDLKSFEVIWIVISFVSSALVSVGIFYGLFKEKTRNIENSLAAGKKLFDSMQAKDEEFNAMFVSISNRLDNADRDISELTEKIDVNKQFCEDKGRELYHEMCGGLNELKKLISEQSKAYMEYLEKNRKYQAGILSVLSVVLAHVNQDTDFANGRNEGFKTLVQGAFKEIEKLRDNI